MVWAAGLATFAFMVLPVQGKDQDEGVHKRVSEFRKTVRRAKVEDEILEAIREISDLRHERVLREFERLLEHDSYKVRRAVIFQIRKYKDHEEKDKALKTLLKTLSREASRARLDSNARDVGHRTAVAVIAAFRDFPVTERVISSLTSLYGHANITLCGKAIQMTGELKIVENVEKLIRLLRQLENMEAEYPKLKSNQDPGKFVRRGDTPSPKGLSPEQAKKMAAYRRKTRISIAAKQALRKLLDQNLEDADAYAKYWAENKEQLMKEYEKRKEEREK